MKIDLHIHSTYSDGLLTYDEIFKLAKENNVSKISITDHDTIINLKNCKLLEEKYGIEIIPGVEISSNRKKLHILGYGIKDFDTMEKKLIDLKIENEERNKESIDILRKNGIDIDVDRVKLISKNNIITYRDVIEYLYIKKYVQYRHDAYKKYIGSGAFAYVPSREMLVDEILELINETGGISVIAHPFTIQENIYELVQEMLNYNLSGIEINKEQISSEDYKKFMEIAEKNDLCLTIGSDFHDPTISNIGLEVEDNYLAKFQKKLKNGEKKYDK